MEWTVRKQLLILVIISLVGTMCWGIYQYDNCKIEGTWRTVDDLYYTPSKIIFTSNGTCRFFLIYYSEEDRPVGFSYYDFFDGNYSFDKGQLIIDFTWPYNDTVVYDYELEYIGDGGREFLQPVVIILH